MEFKSLASIEPVFVEFEWLDICAQTYSVKWEERVAENKTWEIQLKGQKKGNLKVIREEWNHEE